MTDNGSAINKIDIYNRDLLECPWPFFARLRAEAPVLRDEASGIYQVSSHELASKALVDTKTYSSVISHALHGKAVSSERVKAVMAMGYPRPQTLQTADAPIHTRSRKLVDKAFSPRRIAEISVEISELVDKLIDGFAGKGEVEFVREFARPLPMMMIGKQLGVELEDLQQFITWSDAFAAQFSHIAGEDGEVEAAHHVVAFQKYFAAVLKEKANVPTNDIISDIAAATLTDGRNDAPIQTAEALQIIQQVLVAGNETTASSLAEGMKLLIEHPNLLATVRSDPQALSKAIEEIVRIHSPVQTMWRVTTSDTELGGVSIPKDSLVLIRFGSANHDDSVFAEPECFDISRGNLRRHIGFGYGAHSCIGAALARKELSIAFQKLLARIKGWRFATTGNDFTHQGGLVLRGLKSLHLEFDAACSE